MKYLAQLIFSYKGRVGRKTYLIYHICGGFGGFSIWFCGWFLLSYMFEGYIPGYLLKVVETLLMLIGILLLYGTIPVSVKRHHDRDKSGWTYLIWTAVMPFGFNLCFSTIYTIIFPLDLFDTFMLVRNVYLFCFISGFIALCCLPSREGRNEYGDSPN